MNDERLEVATPNDVDRTEKKSPDPASARPWHRDVAKIIGIAGFVLSALTMAERFGVRDQERTQQRLQRLRQVASDLSDVQAEHLELMARAPANLYALGVARDTKRWMLIETATALLEDDAVRARAGASVFGALGTEMSNDGRYVEAKRLCEQALGANTYDAMTQLAALRTLGQLYGVPNTGFQNSSTARYYFKRSLALLSSRTDDSGR